MKLSAAVIVGLCLSLSVFAQAPQGFEYQPNLIPNPGFEVYSAPPIGWFYNGQHFTKVMKYWSSATAASPDVFGPRVRVPAHWEEKDFGKQKPHNGSSMVGITLYGCEEGKSHCREYIQIELMEPLVVGQDYYTEFWVSHLPRSLQINNLGLYCSTEMVSLKTDDLLTFTPQVNTKDIVDCKNNSWVKIAGHFQATTTANYLLIGNFYPDSLTSKRITAENCLPYAYYYIDDVSLRKKEPILPVPVSEDDLTLIKVEEGKLIRLKDIFFETDQAELLPRSYIELRKLLHIMKEHPNMIIQINGHTDIRGDDQYNQDLSERRAKTVVQFLNENGIDPQRTLYRGYGSTLPIAANTSEKGRQLNRRVEFLILKK
ncbi:MAG: hypothetical protein DHS20C18_01210 [Saprospiraceae bacterium]|nr:MAG: hypothetical protein DHS20C18_01210 [Saprospiraceae bacterium]